MASKKRYEEERKLLAFTKLRSGWAVEKKFALLFLQLQYDCDAVAVFRVVRDVVTARLEGKIGVSAADVRATVTAAYTVLQDVKMT